MGISKGCMGISMGGRGLYIEILPYYPNHAIMHGSLFILVLRVGCSGLGF